MSTEQTQLFVTSQISIPLSEIHFSFVKSSGPGGQNVNKVNTQAQLSWDVSATQSLPEAVKCRLLIQAANRISKAGVLRIDCQSSRDRETNRRECLNRLQQLIVQATQAPQVRKKTRIPRAVKERRLRNKKERSKVKRLRKPPSLND